MGVRDWDIVTSYVDSVTTTLKTVTFPKVQEQVKVKNQGNANLTYTIGSQSGTLTPGQSVTVNESISSFTIQAASGTQAFELMAKEKGTEQTEDSFDDKVTKASAKQITVNVNDYSTIQEALNYTATVKGKLKIPNGTYAVWGLNVDSDVQIEMDTYTYFDLTTAPTNQSVFNITGTIGTKVPLAADVALYATSIKVASGSETSFAIGDILKITSNDFFDIDNRTNQGQGGQKKGELVKVASITNDGTNGIINLLMPTVDSYTVTNGVSIQKITPKRRIRIKGGRVFGQGTLTQYGANVLYAENLKFEDFHIENTYTYGIYLKDCQHVTVDKCSFRDIAKTTVGYGVAVYDASQDITVTNSYFDHCKHSITTGGSGEGISNRITFDNNNVLRGEADAIDSHATCRYITVTDNKVYNSKGLGINVEASAGIIKGNLIHSPKSHGMEIKNWTVATLSNYVVSDNQVYHPVGSGIRMYKVGTTNSYIINSTVANNVVIMLDQTASNTNFYHGIRLEGVKDLAVTGNIVVNADRGIYTDANSSGCVITGNNVRQTNRKVDAQGTGHTVANNVIA